MAQPLSLKRGRHSALLLPLLLTTALLSLHLTSALRHDPPSESNFDRPVEVVQSPTEQREVEELAFLNKLPKPIKEVIQLELDDCKKLSSKEDYEQCIHNRRVLVAFTQDYEPGSNPNPVIGSPAHG
ncbi:hypothetical protein R1sor_005596 [Riccia sorocarpa]|uniref:Uncharacterized protein n=1 Tax=Riccia sorocarpa TaxID=122646 RepID=A0ABD3HNV9_9MARC